jgi:hypothetical protein
MSSLIATPRRRKIIDTRHPHHQMSFEEVAAFLEREHCEGLNPLYDDIGYMVNFAVHANLPYRELPNIKIVDGNGQIIEVRANEFTRVAQNFHLTLMAPSEIGLPWGLMPRIAVLWFSTQAVETRSPIIQLGRSRSDFMQSLGLAPTGGKNGSILRFNDMMKRLASCNFTVTYDRGKTFKMRQAALVSAAQFIYDDTTEWKGVVQLTQEFYQNAILRPVPVRWSVINLLRREGGSPLAVDLYVYATHRVFNLESPVEVPFKMLRLQLGSNFGNSRQGKFDFERDVTEKLARVCSVYSQLKVTVRAGKGITLFPSQTSIPRGGSNFRYLDE